MSWSGGGGGGLPQDPVTLATAATPLVGSRVAGDTVDRWQVLADGTMSWGPGNGAADIVMSRTTTSLGRIAGSMVIGNSANGADLVTGGSYNGLGRLTVFNPSTNVSVAIVQPPSPTQDAVQVMNSSTLTQGGFDKVGHLYTRKQTGNTAAVAANNGTTALSLSATSTDEAGTVTFTPANALAADTVVFTVTFATAYANTPVVVLTANGSAAGGLGLELGSVSTTGFSVALHAPPAVGAATAVNYQVIGL